MTLLDRAAFVCIMIGLVAIPQYWLVSNVPLLVLFWIACLPVLAIFPCHYCRRCRHFGCPFNAVDASTRKEFPLQGKGFLKKMGGDEGAWEADLKGAKTMSQERKSET